MSILVKVLLLAFAVVLAAVAIKGFSKKLPPSGDGSTGTGGSGDTGGKDGTGRVEPT